MIVCDNASTDNTESIVPRLRRRDGRVRYHRNAQRHRPGRQLQPRDSSFRAASTSAGTPTTTWSIRRHLDACVDVLDAIPDVVLAYPPRRSSMSTGKLLADYAFQARDGLAARPCIRFAELVLVNHRPPPGGRDLRPVCAPAACGKRRSRAAYARADSVLLVRLAMLRPIR